MEEKMTRFERFEKLLETLEKSEYEQGMKDTIYRAGVIRIFFMTFEFAWRTMNDVLETVDQRVPIHAPRTVLIQACNLGYLKEEAEWLDMLNDCSSIALFYDEADSDELYNRIFDRYIAVFRNSREDLRK